MRRQSYFVRGLGSYGLPYGSARLRDSDGRPSRGLWSSVDLEWGINTTPFFSSFRIVKLPGSFRKLGRSVVRVIRLTEESWFLPAIRPYRIRKFRQIPQSLNLGFVH